jgi:hypothetical protein
MNIIQVFICFQETLCSTLQSAKLARIIVDLTNLTSFILYSKNMIMDHERRTIRNPSVKHSIKSYVYSIIHITQLVWESSS